MLRHFSATLVLVTVVFGPAILPALAQEKGKDNQVKPAVGQDNSKDNQVKPAVDSGDKKSADDQKVKPPGLAVGQEPKKPAAQADDYQPFAPQRSGRPGQYMYAVPTYQGNYIDPSQASYGYGNYGYGGPGYGTAGMCGGYGGYGGYGAYPGANYGGYGGYPGMANYDVTQQAYWQSNPPRMRVGAYNPQTLARYGLAPDPGTGYNNYPYGGYGYPSNGYTLNYVPRMRVTPYSNAAYTNPVQPASWPGSTGISPLYLR
jgi:hypothetical protein